jgi:amino acid adenylation domain-containing protein
VDKQRRFEELLKKRGIAAPQGPVLIGRDDPPPYQLSFAQRRIWFLQQFDADTGAYNDPTALRIKGPLDIAVLERTLNEIIRRHRVLAMIFPARQGQPVQVPHENPAVTVAVTPLPEQPGRAAAEQIREFVNRFSGRPFDLSTDLLVRAALLQIGQDDFALVVNIHHIVLDGWSKGIMLQELMALYRAFSGGRSSPLKELPVQYSDYVHWLHEWLQGKLYESQLAYWKQQLAGAPPVLELPTDHPRPAVPSGRGSLEPFELPKQLVSALHHLARHQDVTLFMVLLAAYNILLFRCSGQEDILIGTPIAGRSRLELENLIGLFVNTLVIRTDLTGDPPFRDLLQRVRGTALKAYHHQDIPFEKLVEELNPRRNLSVTPLFQVMFQLQNAPMPPARISGLSITPIQIDTGFAQVDLSLTLWEEEEAMKGTFEYNSDLFEPPTIRRLTGHYVTLLEGIAADVEQPVSRLPILGAEERDRLLVEWNDTAFDYPQGSTVYRLFDDAAARHPLQLAVVSGQGTMTYRELHQQANRRAHLLQRAGVGAETLVGICLENSAALMVGVMAILKAGAGYIPMDPQYPDGRLMTILKDAGPAVLITQAAHRQRFAGYGGTIIPLEAAKAAAAPESMENCRNDCGPGSVGCVIFTSGSTGEPRGTLINNRSIVNLIFSFIHSYRPGPADRILPLTSIASASFVGEILPMLAAGGGIVLADKHHFLDMKRLAALLSGYGVTILSTVPSMIARLNAVGWDPGKLRLLLSGGETLSAGDIDHLPGSLAIVNGYGLTEATICSTFNILNRRDFSENSTISVGKPIINTRIYILDSHWHPLPPGVPGEIYIAGDGLARGYLNNPELTAERFLNLAAKGREGTRSFKDKILTPKSYTLYRTGDLGSWLPDGTIRFWGRIDTQVQVHGHRIELSEIETHLGLHPHVQDAVVLDREISPGDRRLVAYLVTQNGQQIGSNEWRNWLGQRLPEYMIPQLFEAVEAIPLSANGKVDAAALPVPSGTRPELNVQYQAPGSEIEHQIASIWRELLHLDRVGTHDNFFDLGGHSLLLTQVHSRLSGMYEKELTIVDMFRCPTIHLLAQFIGEDGKPQASYTRIETRAGKQRQAFGSRQFNRRRRG